MDFCPICHHPHLDYTDEECVSCGCDYAYLRELTSRELPAPQITNTMDYETRSRQAAAYYFAGLERVKNTPAPKGQKFPCGSRVRIADDLGIHMAHFPKGRNATVLYTYAHAYYGDNFTSYCLDVDGIGSVAWYEEHQLTAIA